MPCHLSLTVPCASVAPLTPPALAASTSLVVLFLLHVLPTSCNTYQRHPSHYTALVPHTKHHVRNGCTLCTHGARVRVTAALAHTACPTHAHPGVPMHFCACLRVFDKCRMVACGLALPRVVGAVGWYTCAIRSLCMFLL